MGVKRRRGILVDIHGPAFPGDRFIEARVGRKGDSAVLCERWLRRAGMPSIPLHGRIRVRVIIEKP